MTVAKTAYTFASDTAVRVSLKNTSSRPVYLLMGSYIVCQRLLGDSWEYEAVWFTADGFGISFEVAPGASNANEMHLDYLTGPGTYRFLYRAFADPDLRTVLHESDRASPSFDVEP